MIFVAFLVALAFVLGACSKDNIQVVEPIEEVESLISDNVQTLSKGSSSNKQTQSSSGIYGDFYGEIHNAALTNVSENYVLPNKGIDSADDVISSINDFNKSFFNTLPSDERLVTASYDDNFATYNRFVVQDELATDIFDEFSSNNIDNLISDLEALNFVADSEIAILRDLVLVIRGNIEGNVSIPQYRAQVESLVKRWQDEGYTTTNNDGNLTGIVLSIAWSSAVWWDENFDKGFNTKAPPLWVALDAAGAVVGAVTTMSVQIVQDDIDERPDIPNWGAVGTSAVIGAVTASTGAVTRLGRLIKSWF